MTVLDVTIVNVALPSIGKDLSFSQENLQWVLTAYAITFGGFLLLGGRAADLLGRRNVFMAGVVVFTAASLACALATTEEFLIAGRAVQGLGAAIVSPAALSIVSTAFPEGSERNKALGVWGALGGSGSAIGVLLGGILTKYLGWEAIFYVNVPIGILVLILAVPLVRESRVVGARRQYDPLGAVAVTSSLVLLVYGISKAPDAGWGSARTILLLAAAVALFAAFVFIESRTAAPLMPLRIFRVRSISGANVVGVLIGAVTFSMFFLLTLYVQQVLGWGALKTGVTFLATAGTAIMAAGVAEILVNRIGAKIVMAAGFAFIALGLLWYTQIDVDGTYAVDLLPGYLLTGIGIAFAFVPVSIAALAGIEERDAGLASGLINTSQQIGGAVGVAVASTIFTTRFTTLLEAGNPPPVALTEAFQLAFWVIAGIAGAGMIAALTMLRRVELEVEPTAAVAAAGLVPNRMTTAILTTALLSGAGDDEGRPPGRQPS
ncbi:MAG TPA: MFS transporter [Gaiellaceae bacterium]|jgi:EmrB/QacA subfamily drug resistance transporter|nr:MFS transporter [Gaiellaceae bacterium]